MVKNWKKGCIQQRTPPNHRLPGKKVFGSGTPIEILQIFIRGFEPQVAL